MMPAPLRTAASVRSEYPPQHGLAPTQRDFERFLDVLVRDTDVALIQLARQPQLATMTDANGSTALLRAADSGCPLGVIDALVRAGANIEARNRFDGSTPLILAASGGHVTTIIALHTAGADIEAKTNNGNTPLICASANGHREAVNTLLRAAANPQAKDENGGTPLMHAAIHGDPYVIGALLTGGANIEARNNDGNTALIVAAARGRHNAIVALLTGGANIEARNNDGNTALIAAAARGHRGAIGALLIGGANIEARNNDGNTALITAAARGHRAAVADLTAAADLEAKTNDGNTALITAAARGHRDAVAALLEAGANVVANDNRGRTALLRAATAHHRDAADALQLAYCSRGLTLSEEEQQALNNAGIALLTAEQVRARLAAQLNQASIELTALRTAADQRISKLEIAERQFQRRLDFFRSGLIAGLAHNRLLEAENVQLRRAITQLDQQRLDAATCLAAIPIDAAAREASWYQVVTQLLTERSTLVQHLQALQSARADQ